MIGWRGRNWRRLGAALGGAALYAQLLFASWGMLALASPADPESAFGHALCLAGQDGNSQPTAPEPPASSPHTHCTLCALWHAQVALHPAAPSIPLPIAYDGLAPRALEPQQPAVARLDRPPNARAPPTLG